MIAGTPARLEPRPLAIDDVRRYLAERFSAALDAGNVARDLHAATGGNPLFFELMLEHAGAVGANAVVGVRYDATEVMSGVTEVLCYGTAVKVTTA